MWYNTQHMKLDRITLVSGIDTGVGKTVVTGELENAGTYIDVALDSGFGSVATFNRVFRENKGCTPTQYRAIYGTY